MKEAEFLGALLPSHPDYLPVIETIRDKYKLPPKYPDDDPIKDIYLGDEIITIAQFTQDVKKHVLDNIETIFSGEFAKKYKSAKQASEADFQKELEKFSDELKPAMGTFFEFTKSASLTVYKILDATIDEVVTIICTHLLLGDSMEAPQDWFGKVFTMKSGEETVIYAAINELTDLDFMFQQVRSLHKKTYGGRQIKITPKTASTAYYLQLVRRAKNKDKDIKEFVIDEFIRLNKITPPRNKNSPQYAKFKEKVWQRLRKRLKKAEDIVNAIAREGKK